MAILRNQNKYIRGEKQAASAENSRLSSQTTDTTIFFSNKWEQGKKNLTSIYKFKVNNGNIRTICEIYWKLTKHQNDFSGVLIVNFERISYIVKVVSIIDFEQVNPGWEASWKKYF